MSQQKAKPDNQKERLEAIVERARENLREDGEIAPIWIASKPDGTSDIFVVPFTDDEQKAMLIKFLNAVFVLEGYTEYIVVQEAWMVMRGTEQPINPKVSEQPDKKEIVMVMSVNHNGSKMARYVPFHRPEDGGPLQVDEAIDMPEGGSIGGSLASCLDPLPSYMPPEIYEKVQQFMEGIKKQRGSNEVWH